MKRYNLNILGLILLSPDAAEGSAPEVDPLDMPAGTVDTKFPVLKPQLYDMTISEASVTRNKADDGDVLTIKLKTTAEAQTKDGDVVHPGFPIIHRIGVTPTKDYTIEAIRKSVAAVAQAAGKGDATVRSILNDPKQLEGAIVRAKVTVQPEGKGFPESNRVGGFVNVVAGQ